MSNMKSVTDKMSHGFRNKSPNTCTKQFLNLSLLTIFKFYWPFFSGKRTVDFLPEMHKERSWNCSGPFLLMSSCIISYIRRADSLVKRELTYYLILCSHVLGEIALIRFFRFFFFCYFSVRLLSVLWLLALILNVLHFSTFIAMVRV